VIEEDIDGAARNCEATERTSLSDSSERRVRMVMMMSEKWVVGMERWSVTSQRKPI